MDRRTSLKWMLAVSAMPMRAFAQSSTVLAQPKASDDLAVAGGYGADPDLIKTYRPGDLWPLTFTAEQRREAAALCDLIIPADEISPSASSASTVRRVTRAAASLPIACTIVPGASSATIRLAW